MRGGKGFEWRGLLRAGKSQGSGFLHENVAYVRAAWALRPSAASASPKAIFGSLWPLSHWPAS